MKRHQAQGNSLSTGLLVIGAPVSHLDLISQWDTRFASTQPKLHPTVSSEYMTKAPEGIRRTMCFLDALIHGVFFSSHFLENKSALLFLQPLNTALFIHKVCISSAQVLNVDLLRFSFSREYLSTRYQVQGIPKCSLTSHRGEDVERIRGKGNVFLLTPTKDD